MRWSWNERNWRLRERLEFEIIKEKRSFWRSPLIVAILTAGAAALANIYVSLLFEFKINSVN